MSSLLIEQIIEQLDIRAFLETQGSIEFQKSTKNGSQFYCRCPFCGENKKLWIAVSGDKKGAWKCYNCEEKGGIVGLVVKLKNCSKGEAVKAMKTAAGIDDGPKAVKPKVEKSPKTKPENNIPVNSSAEPGEILSGKDDNSGGGPSEEMASTSGHGEVMSMAASEELSGEAKTKPVTARGADGETAGSGEELSGSGSEESSPESKSARPRDIYTRFVEVATLTDAHSSELRTKRGFTEATIDQLSFRSGGQYLTNIIEEMRDRFSDEDLKEAGFLVDANGVLAYNEQLLENRILIPYPDEHGEVYYLRPHKLGFADIKIYPYCRLLLKDNPATLVLTEGEFKAAALLQWSIPALAIPGVSSFAGKYFERLAELLHEFGVKRIVVIFDNEIKDNPAFTNYKEKPEDRFDTDFWAYIMAYKLDRKGIVTRISQLPDEWRENGKVDFDGALAAGKTKDEILRVIDQAIPYKEFLENLPENAKRVVQRKITRHFARLPIKREFNKYVATRSRGEGKEPWQEAISNFVINIKSSFHTPEGIVRNVQFINEYGETSDVFMLEPGEMAGLNEFKKFCFSKGNFVFEGKGDDLTNIWKLEFLRDTGDLVYIPEQIGRIKSNLWLFGNMAIYNGETVLPDNDGVFWIGDCGYKPQTLEIDSDGSSSQSLAMLSSRSVDIGQIAERMKHSLGGYEAYVAIGWALATIFSDEIFKEFKCFPFIFPHGVKGSGKTSLLRWIMAFFGIDAEGFSLPGSSQVHVTRQLAYFSSLGIWFDEYRNEPKVTDKNGYLRSAYNRQSVGKGIKKAFGTRGYRVRGTLIISGEELPKDAGLFSRCIPLQVSAHKRNRQWYDWLQKNYLSFSGFTRELILNFDEQLPRVLENIRELKKALISRDIPDRTAENWAICAATFETLVHRNDFFIRWVEKQCQQWKIIEEDENALNIFFDDINVMLAKDELDDTFLLSGIDDLGNKRLYLWFNGLYNVWSAEYRKKTGREAFDKATILKYLQDEPYYMSYSSNKISFNNNRRRPHILDVDRATDTIKEIAEAAKDQNYMPMAMQTTIIADP